MLHVISLSFVGFYNACVFTIYLLKILLVFCLFFLPKESEIRIIIFLPNFFSKRNLFFYFGVFCEGQSGAGPIMVDEI